MNAIEIENLSINLGATKILTNITLTIEEGSFVTIIGPNGGGKSTLIKTIIGLIPDYQGTIKIFGKSPKKANLEEIGYVPQIKTLDKTFPAIVLELVISGILGHWPKKINKELKSIAMKALEMVGAEDNYNKSLYQLSGGELQRVFLARCFVKKPKILLLDEPNTGIDYASEKDLNNYIDEYKNKTGATVLLITHDWEAAYHHADKVILLNKYLISYSEPKSAFNENNLRLAFGHIGHNHQMHFAKD